MQWCIVSEGLYRAGHVKGVRGYGCQWGGSSATYHHNLLANNSSRSCRFNGARGKDVGQDLSVYLEYINNVNYNWGRVASCYGAENSSQHPDYYGYESNFVNNYYKPGPATPESPLFFFEQSMARKGAVSRGPSVWYLNGNVMEGDASVTADNWKGVRSGKGMTCTVEEMKSDTTQELRVKVMYGVPAPRLTPEQIEELRSRADSLPPVLEQPADDMPDLSGASEQNPR